MAHSPPRVFAGAVYRDEPEPPFHRERKRPPFVRVIEVTGCAELSRAPDRATVTVRVTNRKESVHDATNSVTRRLEYVLQTARQHDVKEENIRVCTSLQREEQEEEELYRVRAEVCVVFSDFEKMQRVRTVLIQKLDKSVTVGEPSYSHSPESLGLLRRRVCVEAVDSARLKASEACCILGQALGRPLQVREEESREWGGAQADDSGCPASLHHSASSRVSVTFELRPHP